MPTLLDKVYTNLVNACGVELAFSGSITPSTIPNWQPFYNQTTSASFTPTYASIASINFTEESAESPAGIYYKQKVVFRFPATDGSRAERIALLHQLKFIKIKLNNNSHILLGRNDIKQNAFPTIKTKSAEHLTEVEIDIQSIAPAGFTPVLQYGLPAFIPLSI